jgi:hypothetical protein
MRTDTVLRLRALLDAEQLTCPHPTPCEHSLAEHAGHGWDDDDTPHDPACTAVGCGCAGAA